MADDGFGKYVGKKSVGAALLVAGAIIIVWYVRLSDDQKAAIWGTARGALLWMGCVAVLPWAMFFVPGWIIRLESNMASAGMLAGFLILDVLLALAMAGWHVPAGWQKAALLFGFLCAAVYNFVVCEYLAGRAEDSA